MSEGDGMAVIAHARGASAIRHASGTRRAEARGERRLGEGEVVHRRRALRGAVEAARRSARYFEASCGDCASRSRAMRLANSASRFGGQ
jgi:hypothetical protein